MRYLLILLIIMLPSAALAQRDQNVEVDRIVDVRLNDEGARVVQFRTENVGRLRADVFASPQSSGAITVTFQGRGGPDESDTEKSASPPVIFPAGRYEAIVQAENPGAAIIQMRFMADIPLDEYESNNSLEAATRIELPFNGLVHLSGADRDWFRVDPDAGGIVGVHLHTTYQFSGPQVGIYNSDGTQILVTDTTEWGYRGMRYVRSTGRPIFIAVWDSNNYGDGDATAFKGLEIVQYSPEGPPASARSLVTLGLESDDPASFQLDLIGLAIGVETVAANEAEGIARELKAAIDGRGLSLGAIVMWSLLMLLIALAGLSIWWQRHRINQIGTRNAKPDSASEPNASTPDAGKPE